MVRYSFLVRISHPLLHTGLSRRILDHLVGTKQHRLGVCCSSLLRSLQVNRQFILCRLFHGKFGRVCAFEYLIDKYSCAIDGVRTISHHPAFLDPSGFEIHGWESVLRHKLDNVSRLILILKTGSDSKRRASTRLLATAADAIYYIGFRYLERFNAEFYQLRTPLNLSVA